MANIKDNDLKITKTKLRLGQKVLVLADTPNGTARAKGKVTQVGDYSFRVKCRKSISADILQPGQKVTISLVENKTAIPISTGFIRVLDGNIDVMVFKLPSDDWQNNRRDFFRGEVSLPITILRADGTEVPCETGNISGGGALVIGDAKFQVGEVVEFAINIPSQGDFGSKARVVWIRVEKDNPTNQFGIKFIDIDHRDQNQICRYVLIKEFEQRRQELKELSERSGNL